ncbi:MULTISPECIES: ABC transporter substrate-binding protein [Catenuloplanes]|uniref:Branched-chain amino acid transport system substrate-binding protein n=1 Tax=Catenuloplanes niger TaxID=587534 RepID=A0AAE3ZQU8_9ACTN|nr:ABC transporter substrate-binding protein [Catenuloplanes niger]MDR7324247.1 branched-chain amino acid transport system substrate-binding protein [Catenuloplanes niger]
MLNRPTITRRGLLVATASALTVAACGTDDESTGPRTASSTDLVIGGILERTGTGTAMGELQARAMELFQVQVNAEGFQVGTQRRTLQLKIVDSGGDPKKAGELAQQLANRDGVNALIGGTVPETSSAISDVAQELQVPFLSLASADDILTPLSARTYTFKVTPDARDVAQALAQEIDRQEIAKASILAGTGRHGDAGVRHMGSALASRDITLGSTVRLPAGDQDFAAAAAEAVLGRPGAIIIWAMSPDAGKAARALRAAGYTGRFFFTPEAVTEETLSEENADAVEGSYAISPGSLGASSLTETGPEGQRRRDLIQRYVTQYGSFKGFAPYAGDGISLLIQAAFQAKSVDRGRLRAYLERSSLEGMAGAYALTTIRHGGMEADSLGVFSVNLNSWVRTS